VGVARMRLVGRALLLIPMALVAAAIGALWFGLDDTASVVRELRITPQDIAEARRIVEAQAGGPPGRARTLTLDERELDLLANYGASRVGAGAARARLDRDRVHVTASFTLPGNPLGRYLNLDATLRAATPLPRFERLRIGRVPVPPALADLLLREGLRRVAGNRPDQLVAEVVRQVRIAERRLTVTYVWRDDLGQRARGSLISERTLARLRAYQERLATTAAGAPRSVSLAALMPELFRAAVERGANGDPVEENRAAIAVLAFYANGVGLAAVAPEARQWPQPPPRTVTLAGREDLAKHFVVSAAISAAAGTPLADAVGLYKELEDARGTSGFSFDDLAADRAGTRFGERAGGSAADARRLAAAVAAGVREDAFMPAVADLPAHLPEEEFRRRYGGVGGAGYEAMMARIEARVAALPLLR